MHYRFISVFRWGIFMVLCAGMIFQPQSPAYAATTLTITPNAWNIIGLDSNTPASGPFRFPVGAKVCNTSGAATTATINFVWDDGGGTFWGDAGANAYINLRAGSLSSETLAFAGNGCLDAYFEVEVNKVAAAFDKTRRYHITATDTSGTVSTPQPRELYVEHLISQNRNAITDVKLNGVSIAPGGTMTLLVGNTYTIELDGGTATQGYNQFEDFINFPNTIFQITAVSTTYSADSNTSHVPNPNPALYANACTWDNNPGSPTYRSCIGGDDKAGGSNVVTTYTVKILSGAGTTQTLNTLLYDFSGSSYHYNADYSVGARYAYIVGPSSVTMQKSFSPKAIAPAGTSALTIKLSNPTSVSFTGVHFTDAFPGSMTLANTTTTNTCGGSLTDNTSGALGVGDVGIALSSGSLAANSTCTITVNVTVPAGTYVNTTGNLFVNVGGTDTDTGNNASDTLTASSAAACTPGQTIAQWTVPNTATNPPDTAGGVPTTTGANVSSAVASFTSSNGGGSTIDGSGGENDSFSWKSWGWKTAGSQILFKVDTSGYSSASVSFYAYHDTAGPTSLTVEYSTNNGTSYSGTTTSAVNAAFGTQYSLSIPQNNTVWVKITASGANNDNSGADLFVDNIMFSGCGIPAPAPTIAKTFRNSAGTADVTSIQKSATSTLRFTLNNNATGNRALTGVAFTDTLPLGLDVVSSTSAQCGGTLTVTNNASPTRDTISLSGGTLAAGGSCTFDVTVTGTREGQYDNVTGYVSSAQSGTSTNYAEDTLDVIAPPALSKSFNLSSISTGNTSTLAFTITNPNNFTSLSGIGFTDTLPVGVTATNGTTNNVCGAGSSLVISGGNSLTVSSGSLAANASCNFSVTVTGTTSGAKVNTTGVVTSTEGGNGSAASATLDVTDLTPLIGLNKQISTDNTNWFKYVGLIPTHNIWYRFTVSNDGETTLNGINLTDSIYSLATCAPALPASLAVGASASCVLGPISVTAAPTPNPLINTATVTTTTYTPSTPVTSTAKYGTEAVALVKNVTESSFTSQGNLLHYSYQVTNSGGYPLLGPVTVSDNKATVTCPAVNTIGDNDDYLDPGESLTCTATYTVAAGDVTAGSVTNTASATVGGVTSNTVNKTVYRLPDFTVSKTNDVSNSVGQNATFNWTIAVSNISSGPGTFSDTQTIVSDTLPGVAGYYPQGALTVTNGSTAPTGTINCSITGTSLSCAASGVVVFPASASFSVAFAVTPTAMGSLANTATVDPGGNVTELDETNNASTNTVTVIGPPSIDKSFSPNPIAVNGISVITFTITNPAANTVALTGVNFTDTYPAGMQNAAAPSASTTCAGGTVTAAASGPSVSLSGATLPVNTSCVVTVTVTAATSGKMINSVTVASTNGGTGNLSTAQLNVISAAKSVVATSEDSTTGSNVAIGEVVRYRLVIDLPEGTTTNLQLIDNIVGNMAYLNDGSTRVAFICNSGANCATSSAAGIGSGPVIPGNSVVAPTYQLPATSITNNNGGATGNPFPDGDNPMFSLGDITNNDNDADAEYVVIEFNSFVRNLLANQGGSSRGNTFTVKVDDTALTTTISGINDQVTIREPAITGFTKSITTTPADAGDSITYQIQFTNSGNAPAFDIALTDALNAILTAPVTVTGSTTGGACGSTASTVSGNYAAPNATATVTCLAAGGTATINITATVSDTALAGYTFGNSASLVYTSLPGGTGTPNGSGGNTTGSSNPGSAGTANGERNGSGGTNDYTVTSNTVNATLANPSIAKAISPAGTQYAIGATIPYQITITVPEGVTGNPTTNLVDTIPTGLTYVPGSLVVAPQAGVTIGTAGPYTDANATFFNLTGQTLTLNFGSFTATASGGATNRTATVSFLARVNNVPGNQSGTTFTNAVDFVRTNPNGAGTLTLNTTSPTASVIEPDLNVAKVASTASPLLNSTLTYTLTINHTGASNATAYDTHIVDTMPAGLTGLTNVNVASVGNCATGVTDNSTSPTLDVTIGTIPLGCVVTVNYDVTVSGAVSSVQANNANMTWTSVSGISGNERTGADGVGGALNDYADSSSVDVTITDPATSVISDFVWNDANGDGLQTSESGLGANIRVYVDGNNNDTYDIGEPNDLTDASGSYAITGLPAGTYNVRVDTTTLPSGFAQTFDLNGGLDNEASVVLGAAQPRTDVDFGYQQQNAVISNFVWNDLNGDGIQDAGEPGIDGVRVYVDSNNNDSYDIGEPAATTAGGGLYAISNLAAGTYNLRVDTTTLPAGFVQTYDLNGGLDDEASITLIAGQIQTDADFGYQQQNALISDFVWHDLNGDGVQDVGEPGIDGVRVYIDSNNNNSYDVGEPNALTAGGGSYSLNNLTAGTYSVRVDITSLPGTDFVPTYDLDGGLDNEASVTLTAGEDRDDIDFGYQQQGTVSGHLYYDTNGNGTQDGTEPDLPNVNVLITPAIGLPFTVTSGPNGNWTATVPPGTTTADVDETDSDFTSVILAGWIQSEGTDPTTATAVAGTDTFTDNDGYFNPNPALNLVKEVSTDNATWVQSVLVNLGDTVYYRVRVANTGNITLTNLTVNDPDCTLTRDTDITGDNDANFEVSEEWAYTCSVNAVIGSHINTATADSTETLPDSDTATYVTSQADLSLTKTVSNTTPPVSTDITFTLLVKNSGPNAATNVAVTDVLPNGFTYVSNNPSQGTFNNNTGIWTVGTLNLNQTETLTITVTVNVSGSYINDAEITASDQFDPDSTPDNGSTNEDDFDSVTITPVQNNPDGLTKILSDSNQLFTTNPNVAIGEIVEYQVSVNIPSGTFDNARLVDTMQRGLSYVNCVAITDNGLTTSVAGGFATVCSTPTVDDASGGTTADVGRRVTFDFATLKNNTGSSQQLVVTYRAVVLDIAGNTSAVNLNNSAEWTSDSGSLASQSAVVKIAEPRLSIRKTSNLSTVSVGSVVTITLTVQHASDSKTNAYDVVAADALPAELQYVPGSLDCTSGAQDADAACTESSGTITAQWSNFLLGGGDGRVTFQVTVLSLPQNGISNTANVVWSSLPGTVAAQNNNVFSTERDYDPTSQVDVYGATDTLVLNNPPSGSHRSARLPATGFAPNVVTNLSNVPHPDYVATRDVMLEIPSLGLKIPIVGVPQKDGTWNISWLENQAGWLQGTAFPSWSGNSVLTGHVYMASGLPGPFVNLNKLKYGDKIIIHAYGQKYTFAVQTNTIVSPDDQSVMKHEEKSWVTLVTCKDYDEKTKTYLARVVVRAVLVSVDWE